MSWDSWEESFAFLSFLFLSSFPNIFTLFHLFLFPTNGCFCVFGGIFFFSFSRNNNHPASDSIAVGRLSNWQHRTVAWPSARSQRFSRSFVLFSFFFFVSCRARVVTGLTVSDQGFNYFFKGVDKTNFSKGRNQNVNKQCWVQSRLTVCLH